MQFPDEANFCPNCAQRLQSAAAPSQAAPAADSDLLGGRFELGAKLGGHRTGDVHEATDTTNGSACVVKLVHEHVFPTPLLKQRTERELKQLERVAANSVAKVLAHGKQGERLWIASERVDGQPLKTIVSQGVLGVDRARAILLRVGEALSEAAKVGVIHRDVSPKNVLVGAGGAVRVINFGVPAPLNATVQGEPEFLSPEQVEGKPVDQRSNIYSLGAIFYYTLTGRPPYTGDADSVMQQHLAGNLVPPSQLGPVPAGVEAVIVKALDRVSSKRFMTLRQMLGEIETAGEAGPADSASQTAPFAAAGKADQKKADQRKDRGVAAKTMMGMYAPGMGPVGADGKPTDVVPVEQQASSRQPPAAVASFAQPSAPQPVQPQRTPTPPPQPAVHAPEPQALSTTSATTSATPSATTSATTSATPSATPAGLPAPVVQDAAPEAAMKAPSVPPGASGSMPGGKRGKAAAVAAAAAEKKRSKGQFRETLWFKKGELDAVAAEAAAAAAEQGQDALAADRADMLPMEDRYSDDGTLTAQDQKSYSLRTGHTQMMQAVDGRAAASGRGMKEDELVSEMKAGRGKFILLIAIGVAALGGAAAFFIFS
jgi:serine/threonine-protein kinase